MVWATSGTARPARSPSTSFLPSCAAASTGAGQFSPPSSTGTIAVISMPSSLSSSVTALTSTRGSVFSTSPRSAIRCFSSSDSGAMEPM